MLRQTFPPPQKTTKAKLKTLIYKSSIHEVKKIIISRQSIVRHRTSKNTIGLIFFFGYLLMGVGAQGGPFGESWVLATTAPLLSGFSPRFSFWLAPFLSLSIRFLEKLPVFKSPSYQQSDCETQVSLQCIFTSAKLITVEILFQ